MGAKPPYKAPTYKVTSFNCPFCHAFASMKWDQAYTFVRTEILSTDVALCSHCGNRSIWYEEEMIIPANIPVEDPNDDLPDEVKDDYKEAAAIITKSPRGAAALLRLAIQELCDSLVQEEGDLNFKIGKLVEQGLHKKIQQALDVVRVIGNEAVHPGVLDLKDNKEVAQQLFGLVNIIGRQMITEPAEIEGMFDNLPEGKKQQIEKRDKNN